MYIVIDEFDYKNKEVRFFHDLTYWPLIISTNGEVSFISSEVEYCKIKNKKFVGTYTYTYSITNNLFKVTVIESKYCDILKQAITLYNIKDPKYGTIVLGT